MSGHELDDLCGPGPRRHFAFALNGALTAIRIARIDIVGAVTLGMCTALGGGMIRDILLGALPPETFRDE